jgi:membrane-associated protease RseP (regulator of RpoE activity)
MLKARFSDFPDTLNFILDTGSGGISLDSTTAVYFGLTPEPSDRTIRGIGGVRKVSFLNNRALHLHNLSVDSLNFHVNDYTILTEVYGERIDGIIGYSLFSRFIVKLDFDKSIIEFWTKGSMKYPKGGYLFKPVINTLPVEKMKIRDAETVNTRFLIDMGAGLNMMLTRDLVKDSALLFKNRKLYTKEAEGLGGKIDMHMTVLREVKFGPYRFYNVPVYVFDDVYNVTSYPYLGGLLGNDLLRRFNLIINYEKKHFYLLPNAQYRNRFDYSYSGIELYFVEGKIIIGDVAVGSPAEKCGLKEGDIIVAINKNFTQNMTQMKHALQNAGEKVKVIITRDGDLKSFEFRIQSILK